MKNTIRCCISCILPCGALDVIRIVHANGRVEEIGGTVSAAEIMKLYPKHVLKKPSSSPPPSGGGGAGRRIVVVPPDAELRRGKIYFLMPAPPPPPPEKSRSRAPAKRRSGGKKNGPNKNSNNNDNNNSGENLLISDRYLSEILSERVSTQRDRRRGRVGVWRPHLESISETPTEA
ncbi:Unknown protein [Striga hermonthica]|uniref:Uncharacterized protein n=1 Tax=Striga hermonthica TaxID=68872 RepID=A0A9N7N0X4_STRHE|nr:Unknown protein [Striga hermonthica]